jgi:hypothetical protein
MGLFDSLKQESQRNFIARADEAKNDILYAYPEHNIRMLTQLTVGADEVALFVKDGTGFSVDLNLQALAELRGVDDSGHCG